MSLDLEDGIDPTSSIATARKRNSRPTLRVAVFNQRRDLASSNGDSVLRTRA